MYVRTDRLVSDKDNRLIRKNNRLVEELTNGQTYRQTDKTNQYVKVIQVFVERGGKKEKLGRKG